MPSIDFTALKAAGITTADPIINGRRYVGAIAEMQSTGMRASKEAMKAP
jgi:hypothetical protein